MKILVYGFKHAGKTTVGKMLAKKMKKPFIDIDNETERYYSKRYGKSLKVREIYKQRGGAFFRKLEKNVLKKIVSKKDFVLSGAPVHAGFDESLKKIEHRVFLDTPSNILISRIKKTGVPAFFDPDKPLEKALKEEYEKRLPEYRKALTIRISSPRKEQCVREIIMKITRPKICVPIQEKTNNKIVQRLKSIGDDADMVEIWLDSLKEKPDFEKILKHKRHQLIMAVKSKKEKGNFKGALPKRISLLEQAAVSGGNYVDIELGVGKKAIGSLRKRISNTYCSVIVSYHNFDKTPGLKELKNIIMKQLDAGADVCKISTMAKGEEDNNNLMNLLEWSQKTRKGELIVLGMGKEGMITRVTTPLLGGKLVFAPYTAKESSAPGQLTVKQLRKMHAQLGV